jgi:uncharacterized protein involved in exopolysaccharide biosynthesis
MEKDIKLILFYLKQFVSNKKLIVVWVGVGLILGLFNVIFSKPIYEAKTSFISLNGSEPSGGSGLKNIAALIGVNIGQKQDVKDIPVYLYPKLTGSVVYNKEILGSYITLRNNDSITIREYVLKSNEASYGKTIKNYTLGLPNKIIALFKKEKDYKPLISLDKVEYLTKLDYELIKYLNEQVNLTIDTDDGSLHIIAQFDDPLVAAQVVQKSKEILQELIINYRIGKLQDSYDFIESQYQLKKKEYKEARNALASYVDRNRFNSTASSQIRRNELESSSALAYSLYSELETQRINAQIGLKEETPIFTTIEPSIIPIEKSNPSAIVTIIKHLIFGLFVAVIIYGFSVVRNFIKTMWRDTKPLKNN